LRPLAPLKPSAATGDFKALHTMPNPSKTTKSQAESPFQRFKKATKEILSVSRKDLQEEMDKFKREKSKRKR